MPCCREIRLIRQLQPVQNRRLRRSARGVQLAAGNAADGFLLLVACRQPTRFASLQSATGCMLRLEASNTLRKLADLHQLCLIRTGLEAANRSQPRPCSACQLKRCRHMYWPRALPAGSIAACWRRSARCASGRGVSRDRSAFVKPMHWVATDLHLLDRWCYQAVSVMRPRFSRCSGTLGRHLMPMSIGCWNRQGKWLDGDRIVSLGGRYRLEPDKKRIANRRCALLRRSLPVRL